MSETEQNGLAGMPGWARVIAQVGLPGALILLFAWFMLPLLVKQGEALPRIEQKLDTHIEATKSLETAVHKGAEEQHEHGLRLEGYLRLVCVNSAKTAQERNTCLSVR